MAGQTSTAAAKAWRAALCGALLGASAWAHANVLPLLPWPAQVERSTETLRLAQGAVIVVPRGDAGAERAARSLADLAWRDRGLQLTVRPAASAGTGGSAGQIVFRRLAPTPRATPRGASGTLRPADDSYQLDITSRGATLSARSDAGLYYASVSLWQLISADAPKVAPAVEGRAPVAAPPAAPAHIELPGLRIQDAPRFQWRGLMLDVARHFAPVEDVKALIDQMALHKLNVLHLHLSDDQGWRLEIKRYPDLTRVGAWRTPPGGEPARYGGFYTQAQMRDVVAYAAQRFITVVPEFDMPGHAQAAVAAYPQFGVDIGDGPGQNKRPAVSVDWGVNPYLFNVDDGTMRFLREVFDEVMAVFPSTFIHVGGDEAIKDQWKASPAVQQRMKALGLKTEEQLQSWFIDSLGDYFASKGRRLIGWDEILEGGLPDSASVMSWRGIDGAVAAARKGHDVVLAPAGWLYLDNLQSSRADEPEGRLATLPIEKVYGFEPVPSDLDESRAHHVLGLEAPLWTEYMPSRRHAEHAIFPRIAALAEVAWSPKAARDWSRFLPRLAAQQQRYWRHGVGASDSAFAVQLDIDGGPAAALAEGKARVRLSNQLGYGDIRYTLDGSVPTINSMPFLAGASTGIDVPLPARVRANVFSADGTPLAAVRDRMLDRASLLARPSNGLRACPNGDLGLRVPLRPEATDWRPVFNVNIFDACWIYPQARLDGVVAIAVDAARLARNYGLAHDIVKVVQHPASTPQGELEVRQGDCAGPMLARIPLPEGTALQTLPLSARLPQPLAANAGVHDLCLRFTAPITGPLYAIDQVRLLTADLLDTPAPTPRP